MPIKVVVSAPAGGAGAGEGGDGRVARTGRDPQDLRPGEGVVRPHPQVPAQPPVRAGGADRAATVRVAGDAHPGALHARPAGPFAPGQPEPGGTALSDAAGPRPAMPADE